MKLLSRNCHLAKIQTGAFILTCLALMAFQNCGQTGFQIASSSLAPANTDTTGNGTPTPTPTPMALNGQAYVSVDGDDSNDGLTLQTPKLTLQAAENLFAGVSGGGVVNVAAGTYSLTKAYRKQPGVKTLCATGATITQADGADLTTLIDFDKRSASGASIINCILDGNRAGNTDNANSFILYLGNQNNIVIRNNIIQNSTGYGIILYNGLSPVISKNTISNCFVVGIAIGATNIQTPTTAKIANNTFQGPLGQHAIAIQNSDSDTISGNTITATNISGINVNVSGTTVTWVAGPTFDGLAAGEFLILNGGEECNIQSVDSSTSLTVTAATCPSQTLTNVYAVGGPGDLIGIGNSSLATVTNNNLSGGASIGIVISDFTTLEAAQLNLVSFNTIQTVGGACISEQSTTTTGAIVQNNTIQGNNLTNCGSGGAAVATTMQSGISLIDFSSVSLYNSLVESNQLTQASGQPLWGAGIYCDGIAAGQINPLSADGNAVTGGASFTNCP